MRAKGPKYDQLLLSFYSLLQIRPSLQPQPQALVFFTSSKTRQGLSTAHTTSTEAVAVSSKTTMPVDDSIQQVMGWLNVETRTLPPPSLT